MFEEMKRTLPSPRREIRASRVIAAEASNEIGRGCCWCAGVVRRLARGKVTARRQILFQTGRPGIRRRFSGVTERSIVSEQPRRRALHLSGEERVTQSVRDVFGKTDAAVEEEDTVIDRSRWGLRRRGALRRRR